MRAHLRGYRKHDQSSKAEIQEKFAFQRVARSEGREGAIWHPQPEQTMQEGGLNAVHRDVDNALEQSGEVSSEIDSHRGIGSHRVIPTCIVNGRSKGRFWMCFPTLRQFFKPHNRSKQNPELNDLVSYQEQERLQFPSLLIGESSPFGNFLLDVPDCPDGVNFKVSADQRSQKSYQRNPQETQISQVKSAEPQLSHLQRNESGTSSTSSHCVSRSGSPPGEAALRSLTPGVRSSKSSTAVSGVRKESTTLDSLTATRPSLIRLSNSEVVEIQEHRSMKSSHELDKKQQIPSTVRKTSRSASCKPPTKVVPCRTRSDRILSRAQHRFQISIKRDRIPSNRISVRIRPRSEQQVNEPEIQPMQEEVNNRISCVRTGRKSGVSPGAKNNHMAPVFIDHIKQTRENYVSRAESQSPSIGSHNDIPSVQLAPPEAVTVCHAAKAYVRLIDLSPPKSCYWIPRYQENVEVEKTNRSPIPIESCTSTNTPKAATSHITLMDSTTSNSLLLESSNTLWEEFDNEPTPRINEPLVKLPTPSESIMSYPKPRVWCSRPTDIVNIKSTRTSSSSSDPQEGVSSPPLVASVPQSLFRLSTDTCKLSRNAGTATSSSGSSAAGDGTNRVDAMVLDVLRELKGQLASQSPPRRRAYEVAIPTGVWRLDFIPNNTSTSSLVDSAPRKHPSLSRFSTTLTSFSKKSVDCSNGSERQRR